MRYEADHPQTVLALVEEGLGVSLVPASAAPITKRALAWRDLRPAGPSLETMLVWRRDLEPGPAQAFAAVVREIVTAARGPRAAADSAHREVADDVAGDRVP